MVRDYSFMTIERMLLVDMCQEHELPCFSKRWQCPVTIKINLFINTEKNIQYLAVANYSLNSKHAVQYLACRALISACRHCGGI
uniref:Uncharacterized protein n=1 Tax=Anguilla anguilla TaxID=7936 RepID=A0A0E9T2F2_ANGAN